MCPCFFQLMSSCIHEKSMRARCPSLKFMSFEISRRAQQLCSNRVALPTGRLLEGDVFLRRCGWPESWLYSGLQSRHQSFCSTKMCGIVISENVRHNPTGTTQRNQQRCHSLVHETEESFSDRSYWRDESISEGNAPPPGIST